MMISNTVTRLYKTNSSSMIIIYKKGMSLYAQSIVVGVIKRDVVFQMTLCSHMRTCLSLRTRDEGAVEQMRVVFRPSI
jgi:hypothetical protein